ncbi:MAG: BON domain-containing protein [Proteobacteria bacterium]|nr:BON domain-containing protein [Pseudomonadota bacterium]MDA1135479.1 BON domain-containing protein [Pseudomonadota bacterium]
MIKFSITILFLFIFQSCAPVIGVLGVTSIGSATKEKSLGSSINDGIIHTKILNKIYKLNPVLSDNIKVSVDNGSVLLTGKIKKPIDKIKITQLIWEIKGVKEVNNELQITDSSNIKNIARDIASVAEIRARIITDERINSLNFSIDVVNDIAYISGFSENKEEVKLVTDHATKARFVKEIFNYITINDDNR